MQGQEDTEVARTWVEQRGVEGKVLDASSVWEYRGETEREEGQGMQKAIKRSSRSLGLTLGMDRSLSKKRELGAML